MSLPQFFMILRARFWVVVLTLVVTVGAIVGASLVLPKKYTATAAVVADVTSPDPISGAATHAMMMPGYMATQRDIITSERVAQRVKKLLEIGMPTGPLRSKLDVKPSRESNVIEIGYSSPDPRFAAAAANAFAQAYIEASIELRVDPARQYARWFGEQDKALRENLAQAQRNLSEHQQKYGILASDEKLDVETNRLNDLTAQLTALQSQMAESRGRQRSGAAATSLPEVVQNPLNVWSRSDKYRYKPTLIAMIE